MSKKPADAIGRIKALLFWLGPSDDGRLARIPTRVTSDLTPHAVARFLVRNRLMAQRAPLRSGRPGRSASYDKLIRDTGT